MKQKSKLRLIFVVLLVALLAITLFACNKNDDKPKPSPIQALKAATAFDLVSRSVYSGPSYFFNIEAAASLDFKSVSTGGGGLSSLNGKKYLIEAKINLDTDPEKDFIKNGSENEIFVQITEAGQASPLFGIYYDDSVDNRPGIGIILKDKKYYISATSLALLISKQEPASASAADESLTDIIINTVLETVFDDNILNTEANTLEMNVDLSKVFGKLKSLFDAAGLGGYDIDQILSDLGIDLTKQDILALAPQIKLNFLANFDNVMAKEPKLKDMKLTLKVARDENVHIQDLDGNTVIDFTIPQMEVELAVSKLAITNGSKLAITMPDMSEWTKTEALNLNVAGKFNLMGSDENGATVEHSFDWKLISNLDPFLMLEKNFLLDDPEFAEKKSFLHFQVSHKCTDEEKADKNSWCSRHMAYSDGAILDIYYDPANLDPKIFLNLNLMPLLPTDFINGLLEAALGDTAAMVGPMLIQILDMTHINVPIDTQAFSNAAPTAAAAADEGFSLDSILGYAKAIIGVLGNVSFDDGLVIGTGILGAVGGNKVTDDILAGMSIEDIVMGILEAPAGQLDESGNPVVDSEGNPVIIKNAINALKFTVDTFSFGTVTADSYNVLENAMLKHPDGSVRTKFDLSNIGEANAPAIKNIQAVKDAGGYIPLTFMDVLSYSSYLASGSGIELMPSEVESLAGALFNYTYESIDGETYASDSLVAQVVKVVGFDKDVTGEQIVRIVGTPTDGAGGLVGMIYGELGMMLSGLGVNLPRIPGSSFETKIKVIPQIADEKVTVSSPLITKYGSTLAIGQVISTNDFAAVMNFDYEGLGASDATIAAKSSIAAKLTFDPEFFTLDMTKGYIVNKEGTTEITVTALGVSKKIPVTIGKKVAEVTLNGKTLSTETPNKFIAYAGQKLSTAFGTEIQYKLEGDDKVYTVPIDTFIAAIEKSVPRAIGTYNGEKRFVNVQSEIRNQTFNFRNLALPYTIQVYTPTVTLEGKTEINMMQNWKDAFTGVRFTYGGYEDAPYEIFDKSVMVVQPDTYATDKEGRVKIFGTVTLSNKTLSAPFNTLKFTDTITVNAPTNASCAPIQVKLGDAYFNTKIPEGFTLTFADGTTFDGAFKGESISNYLNISSASFVSGINFIKSGEFEVTTKNLGITSDTVKITIIVEAPQSTSHNIATTKEAETGTALTTVLGGVAQISMTFADESTGSIGITLSNWSSFLTVTDSDGAVVAPENFLNGNNIAKAGVYTIKIMLDGNQVGEAITLTVTDPAPAA